jgi:hypothetical protein
MAESDERSSPNTPMPWLRFASSDELAFFAFYRFWF